MPKMKHAEVIKHMAEYGWKSVQCKSSDDWQDASWDFNPVTQTLLDWRIKPQTITITCEIPKPDGNESDFPILTDCVCFKRHEDCIAARDAIVAAIRAAS
jgi:hypothetical protein